MASKPSAPPLPFDPPVLYPAKRTTGFVNVPVSNSVGLGQEQSEATIHATGPPPLERTSSLAGNILVVQLPCEEERAYWIQRKMCNTTRGSLRMGFRLKKSSAESFDWTVQPSESGPYAFEVVAIKIQDKATVESSAATGRDASVEFTALQTMEKSGEGHVLGTREVCTDGEKIYIIMPYHGEGSLFEYVVEAGRLSEGVARYFFQQIISGLSTMQQAGLCHRDLSLDHVLLRGTTCHIVGLGLSLRVPPDGALLEPQTSFGSNLLYVAPEIVQNVPFNGYAVDLWAAGVMLGIMLFGTKSGAPFSCASPDDKLYREVCIKGNLVQVARENWNDANVSDEALDLLQNMLKADPADRLTLQGIREHPWFLAEAAAPEMPTALQNLAR